MAKYFANALYRSNLFFLLSFDCEKDIFSSQIPKLLGHFNGIVEMVNSTIHHYDIFGNKIKL